MLITFAVIGVGFLFIGWNLKRALRFYNEDMEIRARRKINFAMYIMSLPFIARSIWTFLRIVSRLDMTMDESIKDDTWTAP
jgi:Na+/proline symporter